MLTPSITPNQIRSMPSFSAAGAEQRHDDEGELEEVEEEGQDEDQALTTIRKPISPPGSEVSRCSTQMWPLTP